MTYSRMMNRCSFVWFQPRYFTIFTWCSFFSKSISDCVAKRKRGREGEGEQNRIVGDQAESGDERWVRKRADVP
jgi:hypothetical protein